MNAELSALVITAASIGFLHTLLGPDHYLPFIMMSWARKWSRTKTMVITFLCGLGHIASSIVLGMIGVSLGIAVKKLELIESSRGNVAAWLLIAFGLAYLVWGLRRAYKNKPHVHAHVHMGEDEHQHPHDHHLEHYRYGADQGVPERGQDLRCAEAVRGDLSAPPAGSRLLLLEQPRHQLDEVARPRPVVQLMTDNLVPGRRAGAG